MKRTSLALAAALALSSRASAQSTLPLPPPCVKGTLASYVALGPRGCSVGTTIFTGFSYTSPSTAIGADKILVSPSILATPRYLVVGFSFQASWAAKAGQILTSVIAYTSTPSGPVESPPGFPLTTGELSLNLGGAQVLGIIGSVVVQEATSVGDLSVFERCADACSIKQSDRLFYTPLQRAVKVVDTVTVTGGSGGALLTDFEQTFNPTFSVN